MLPSKHETLGNVGLLLVHRLRRWPNRKPALRQRLMFAGLGMSLTKQSPNACSMLVNRLRRWPNIESALGESLLFAGYITDGVPPCMWPYIYIYVMLCGSLDPCRVRTNSVHVPQSYITTLPLPLTQSHLYPGPRQCLMWQYTLPVRTSMCVYSPLQRKDPICYK